MDKILSPTIITPCNDSCNFCFLNFADVLSENYLFSGYSTKEVEHIIKSVKHQVRFYSKGELIVHLGRELNNLFLVVKGSAASEFVGHEGKVLRINEINPPELIGSEFLFSDCHNIPYDVVAKTDIKAIVIPKSELLNALMNNKKLLLNFFSAISCKAIDKSNRIKDLGLNSLKGRVANYLLSLSNNLEKDDFVLEDTQTDLAEIFGVARPSISRIFKELDKEGLIHFNGKRIQIINKKALRNLFN